MYTKVQAAEENGLTQIKIKKDNEEIDLSESDGKIIKKGCPFRDSLNKLFIYYGIK